MYNYNSIFGKDDAFIDYASLSVPVHKVVVKPFLTLKHKAKLAGFELQIASGYRSFERQLMIWNDKVNGLRPVLDDAGMPIDLTVLTPWEQVQAILRWSALPGSSRHHWGTDLDVYDSAAVSEDYKVQLSLQEVADDGPFGKFHLWLDDQIKQGNAEGFFRPYNKDKGGTFPERWHLSYYPLANNIQSEVHADTLASLLQAEPILLKETLLEHLEEIVARFISLSPLSKDQ